jgi:outer membrane receptor protein involved in Fe transport
MAKSGDSDAAGALKRVTGVTVVGGKYVFVRGLGERYSSTLLNGSTLPSPEPERRVVPLDMFPADLLESLVIQKTFSPDMPGEFGGGSVQIRTKSFPEELTAKLSFSTGFVLGTTFYKGLMYEGGRTDWLGIDDGTRSLPKVVEAASRDSSMPHCSMFVTEDCFEPGDLERIGEAMPNIYDTYRKTVPPDLGLSVTVGNSFPIRDAKAGYLVSLVYKNDWNINEEHRVFTKVEGEEGTKEVVPTHEYDFESLNNKVTLAGILNFGVEISEGHQIKLVSLLDRITDNETRIYEGYNTDLGGTLRVTRLRWIERMLFAQQVQGVHVFPGAMDLTLDWRYTFSLATRLEPDRRVYRKDLEEADEEDEEDKWILSDRPEGNERLFSELMDQNHDVSLDITLPFSQWTGEQAEAMVGFTSVVKDREVDTRRYHYVIDGMSTDVLAAPLEHIFSSEWIGPENNQAEFEDYTRQTDNYLAEQLILAGYTLVDLPLGAGLRVMSGVRFELSEQTVKTFELFNPDAEPVTANLSTKDWLPAVALTWALPRGHQLRLGFSRTVSRPDFRELSPATFNDVTGGRQIFGNPDLKRAMLTNLDLRWEWYIAPGESLSVAFFYKNFQDPIEQVVQIAAQHTLTWENAKAANNLGVEVELRKSFDFVHDKLRDLYVAFNGAYIYSLVQLKDDEGSINTTKKRPLQGQSPWVFNVQLGYDNVDWGTSLVLLYNVFGRRISGVGALGAPDIYEQPFHQLDFVYRQKLAHGFALGFKARNIIDLPATFKQGDITTHEYRKGRELSVSVSKTF